MPMNKVSQTFEIEQEQLDWLGQMAEQYGLADESKSYARPPGLRNSRRRERGLIFAPQNARCRFCG